MSAYPRAEGFVERRSCIARQLGTMQVHAVRSATAAQRICQPCCQRRLAAAETVILALSNLQNLPCTQVVQCPRLTGCTTGNQNTNCNKVPARAAGQQHTRARHRRSVRGERAAADGTQ